jgi:hypothetical protein
MISDTLAINKYYLNLILGMYIKANIVNRVSNPNAKYTPLLSTIKPIIGLNIVRDNLLTIPIKERVVALFEDGISSFISLDRTVTICRDIPPDITKNIITPTIFCSINKDRNPNIINTVDICSVYLYF